MKQRRHEQIMEIEQRSLQIEEARVQENRQGMANFVNAISNLSNAIHSIISSKFNPKTWLCCDAGNNEAYEIQSNFDFI